MLSDDDILEAVRLRRRRLVTAFDSGSEGRAEVPPSDVRRLLAGTAVGAVIALGVGLGGLVQASLRNGGITGQPAAAPTQPPAPSATAANSFGGR